MSELRGVQSARPDADAFFRQHRVRHDDGAGMIGCAARNVRAAGISVHDGRAHFTIVISAPKSSAIATGPIPSLAQRAMTCRAKLA